MATSYQAYGGMPTTSVTYAAAAPASLASPVGFAASSAVTTPVQYASLAAPVALAASPAVTTPVQYAAAFAAGQPACAVAPATCPMSRVGEVETAPWGGGCPWQYDKTSFKNWLKAAFANPRGNERKELYGFVAECFLDADSDRDGFVGRDEFDGLIEKAAAMPRRFGLAPSWTECYGDVARRQQARTQMFNQMDKHRRGKIGMEEWVAFVMAHIQGKVATMPMGTLDFCHLENAGAQQFIDYLSRALANRHSEEFKSLYEFLFKTFVESDVDENGAITRAQFDILIEDAAKAPRAVGLAPTTAQTYATDWAKKAGRDAEFAAMDTDKAGSVTFDKFLSWALTHIAAKVQKVQSGARLVPTAQPVTSAAPVTYAAPVQYASPVSMASIATSQPTVIYRAQSIL